MSIDTFLPLFFKVWVVICVLWPIFVAIASVNVAVSKGLTLFYSRAEIAGAALVKALGQSVMYGWVAAALVAGGYLSLAGA